VPQITSDELRVALRLPADADTALSFDQLGLDSWDFIEFRAVLETQYGMVFSDEDWVSINCPNDVLRNGNITK
jgi:acyl carrier protein